jgi:hypothetical protein
LNDVLATTSACASSTASRASRAVPSAPTSAAHSGWATKTGPAHQHLDVAVDRHRAHAVHGLVQPVQAIVAADGQADDVHGVLAHAGAGVGDRAAHSAEDVPAVTAQELRHHRQPEEVLFLRRLRKQRARRLGGGGQRCVEGCAQLPHEAVQPPRATVTVVKSQRSSLQSCPKARGRRPEQAQAEVVELHALGQQHLHRAVGVRRALRQDFEQEAVHVARAGYGGGATAGQGLTVRTRGRGMTSERSVRSSAVTLSMPSRESAALRFRLSGSLDMVPFSDAGRGSRFLDSATRLRGANPPGSGAPGPRCSRCICACTSEAVCRQTRHSTRKRVGVRIY